MSSRTFFFLKDSVKGGFYTGQNNALMEFKDAAVYFQEKNAKAGMKRVISAWEHQQKYADHWIQECKKKRPEDQAWAKTEKDNVILRETLPNWGIEIVSGTVTL